MLLFNLEEISSTEENNIPNAVAISGVVGLLFI